MSYAEIFGLPLLNEHTTVSFLSQQLMLWLCSSLNALQAGYVDSEFLTL